MDKKKEEKNISLTVRFPPDIHTVVEQIAKKETRSINEQILHFVKLCLKKDDPEIDNGQKDVIEKETDAINK